MSAPGGTTAVGSAGSDEPLPGGGCRGVRDHGLAEGLESTGYQTDRSGRLKRELMDRLVAERNDFAKRVMETVER